MLTIVSASFSKIHFRVKMRKSVQWLAKYTSKFARKFASAGNTYKDEVINKKG